jgi:hypothetical protein
MKYNRFTQQYERAIIINFKIWKVTSPDKDSLSKLPFWFKSRIIR